MNDFFLILHVLSAAAWIGGGLFNGFVAPRMARSGGEAALGWARTSAEAGIKYYNPAGVLTVLTGAGLVLVGDLYDWSDTFVSIGLGVALAAALIAVFRPSSGLGQDHRRPRVGRLSDGGVRREEGCHMGSGDSGTLDSRRGGDGPQDRVRLS